MKQRFFCSLIVVVLLALVSSLACAAEEFLSDSVQGDEPTDTLTEAGKAKSALPDIQEYKHRKPCASCKPQPVAEPQPQPPE